MLSGAVLRPSKASEQRTCKVRLERGLLGDGDGEETVGALQQTLVRVFGAGTRGVVEALLERLGQSNVLKRVLAMTYIENSQEQRTTCVNALEQMLLSIKLRL